MQGCGTCNGWVKTKFDTKLKVYFEVMGIKGVKFVTSIKFFWKDSHNYYRGFEYFQEDFFQGPITQQSWIVYIILLRDPPNNSREIFNHFFVN